MITVRTTAFDKAKAEGGSASVEEVDAVESESMWCTSLIAGRS